MRFPEGGDIHSGALWPCSDAKMRRYWPILVAWVADHMEHANHIGIKYHTCPKCQTLKDALRLHIVIPDL